MKENNSKGSVIVQTCLYLGIFAVCSLGLLYKFQDKMLYLPGTPIKFIHENPKGYRSPTERELFFANVKIETQLDAEDEEQTAILKPPLYLEGWFIQGHFTGLGNTIEYSRNYVTPLSQRIVVPNSRLIVFFQENAGNLGLRLDYFESLIRHLPLQNKDNHINTDILAVSYRGYSGTEGTPTEKSLKFDAMRLEEFISQYFKDKYDNGIFVIGRSLGGAVAVSMMAN